MTGRFAPSPSGRMHLGNIYTALLSWLFARSSGGRWLLRIEDLDPERSKQCYADMILADLEWLGLDWDGEVVFQSERHDIYEHYFDVLQSRGLLYPCFCRRADILATQAPHQSDNRVVYAGTCRALTADEVLARQQTRRPAWRLRMPGIMSHYVDEVYGPQQADMQHDCGDIIIRRADGAFAYPLAVTIDDALMGIDEVVRGCDLLLSAHQQNTIAGMLGFAAPHYAHLPLLCNMAGQRLSKRDESMHLGNLRQRYTASQLVGLIAHIAGITPTADAITPQQLLGEFAAWDITRLGRQQGFMIADEDAGAPNI